MYGARDQIRTGIPFEVFDLSYSSLANRSRLPLPLASALNRKGPDQKTTPSSRHKKGPPLFEGQTFSVCGARDQIRTGDPHVGNVMLYQLSYSCFELVVGYCQGRDAGKSSALIICFTPSAGRPLTGPQPRDSPSRDPVFKRVGPFRQPSPTPQTQQFRRLALHPFKPAVCPSAKPTPGPKARTLTPL